MIWNKPKGTSGCLFDNKHSIRESQMNQLVTLLYDELVKTKLNFRSFYDFFLHSVIRDKSEHPHLLHLADTMGSILKTEKKLKYQLRQCLISRHSYLFTS